MAKLLLGVILITLLCVSANAQTIIVEAENYVASYDQGGVAIYVTSCSGASGNLAVEGFDFPGDWIEVIVTFPENGTYCDSLRSGGLSGYVSKQRSTMYRAGPVGEDLVSPFETLGAGIG